MKRFLPPLLLVLLLALAVGGYWYAHRPGPAPATTGHAPATRLSLAADAPQRAFLRIAAAAEAPLPSAGPFNGRLASEDDHTARIFPAVAGRLTQVPVNVGDRVAKGAVLAVLDSPDFAAAVADLRRAEADAEAKDKAAQRARSLAGDDALSRRELEATEADARSAKAELERARARIANLGGIGGDGHTQALRRPIDGVVVARQANPGSEVRPDAGDPLFVVAALDRLTLYIDLPEKDAAGVRPGDAVLFSTETDDEGVFNAAVERIAPAVDPATRRVTVRARVDNRAGRFRPEMYARVFLASRNKDGAALRVPVTALLTQGLNATVFVESPPGQFERRVVRVLRQDRDYAWLAGGEGLRPGEPVVVKGALLLASELTGAD